MTGVDSSAPDRMAGVPAPDVAVNDPQPNPAEPGDQS